MPNAAIPRVLTIGGSDSSGAAGIQSDLKTFEAQAVYGLSALTVITAQNSLGIQSSRVMEADFVAEQVRAVAELGIGAVKTGLLLREEIVIAVSDVLRDLDLPLIVDPVLVAGNGRQLTDAATIDAYKALLFPQAWLITPNLYEAQLLTGRSIHDINSLREAAKALQGPAKAVLIKGDFIGGDEALDVFYDGTTFHSLAAKRLPVENPRGAGDAYASAIAAQLAQGVDLLTAVKEAKRYVTAAIEAASKWHFGAGTRGVLFHGVDSTAGDERQAS